MPLVLLLLPAAGVAAVHAGRCDEHRSRLRAGAVAAAVAVSLGCCRWLLLLGALCCCCCSLVPEVLHACCCCDCFAEMLLDACCCCRWVPAVFVLGHAMPEAPTAVAIVLLEGDDGDDAEEDDEDDVVDEELEVEVGLVGAAAARAFVAAAGAVLAGARAAALLAGLLVCLLLSGAAEVADWVAAVAAAGAAAMRCGRERP